MLETSTSPGVGERRDARADVDGDALDARLGELDLARVQPGADLEAERRERASRIAHAQRTARAGPSNVARNPSPVDPDLLAAVALELASRTSRWWSASSCRPAPVAELGGALGRADDVGEEHGREHAIGLAVLAASP